MNAILFILAGSALGQPLVPRLVCETPAADLGELKAGAPLTHSFKLVNRSPNQTVKLVGAKVSCGCSKHSFDRETVKPGETVTFTAQINTLAQAAGAWSWSATLRFRYEGGSDEETLKVSLIGKLSREIVITPPGLAFSLESGSVTQEIVIEDTRATTLTIKGASTTAAHLKAVLKAGEKPGQHKVAVTVDTNAPLGEHRDTIVLATGDPQYPELMVPVQVMKKNPAKVKADPSAIFGHYHWGMGNFWGDEHISLRRPDGKSLQISTCEIDDGNITLKWSKDAGSLQRVTIRFPERYKRTPGKAELKITLLDPVGEMLTIPVEWAQHR